MGNTSTNREIKANYSKNLSELIKKAIFSQENCYWSDLFISLENNDYYLLYQQLRNQNKSL